MNDRPLHEVTFYSLCNDVLRRRWMVTGVVLLSAAASVGIGWTRPRSFTSSTSFIVEAIRSVHDATAAPGLLRIRRHGPSIDPGYHAGVARTRGLLIATARSRYTISGGAGERIGTAADMYGIAGDEGTRIEDAARRLAREVEVTYGPTGVVTIRVRTFHPEFARAVAARMLELLVTHNEDLARQRGEAQAAFLTAATRRARAELGVAEDRLSRFLQANRAFWPGSEVALQQSRLDEEMLDRRQQYANLSAALEGARIDGSRPTRAIFILDHPQVPASPDPRGLLRVMVAGIAGGASVALLIVLTAAQAARLRAAGSRDLAELASRWHAALRRRTAPGSQQPSSSEALVGSGERAR